MPDPAEFNLILLILATAPLFVGLVFLRNRQRRIGGTPHCRRCDYILRGNPSGACPECGAPVDPPHGVVYGDLIRSTPHDPRRPSSPAPTFSPVGLPESIRSSSLKRPRFTAGHLMTRAKAPLSTGRPSRAPPRSTSSRSSRPRRPSSGSKTTP